MIGFFFFVFTVVGVPQETAKQRAEPLRAAGDGRCGVHALFLVLESHGIETTLPELDRACGLTEHGTTFAGLSRAARSFQLDTGRRSLQFFPPSKIEQTWHSPFEVQPFYFLSGGHGERNCRN